VLDAVLSAQAWGDGVDILIAEVNIADMATVIRSHGARIIPVPVDPNTLSPRMEDLEQAITSNTRALLIAHLFGGHIDMADSIAFARRHDLVLIEDCAQALTSRDDRGSRDADVSLYSLGPVKTATALGGGLSYFRDQEMADRVRKVQASWQVQSRSEYLVRVVKFTFLKAMTYPTIFAVLVVGLRRSGRDPDVIINKATRGFGSDPDQLLARIRQQPSTPLLRMMRRRMRRFPQSWVDNRAHCGDDVARAIGQDAVIGGRQSRHSHWYFPVRVSRSETAISELRGISIDATTVLSTNVISLADSEILREVIMVPVYPEIDSSTRESLRSVLADHAVESGSRVTRTR
jgi:dTDP-4-amino-4,6-dideoxygalactose transaminase